MNSVTSNAVFNSMYNATVASFWQDDSKKDPLSVADMFATDWYTAPLTTDRFASFRLGHINSENSPYGNGNTDFYYHMFKLADGNWIKLLAYDVRDSGLFQNTKTNGVWQGWEKIHQYKIIESETGFTEQECLNANSLGGMRNVIIYGRGTLSNFGRFLSQLKFQSHNFQGVFSIELSDSQTISYTIKNKFRNDEPSVSTATKGTFYLTNPWIFLPENNLDNAALSWEGFWEYNFVTNLRDFANNTVQAWLSIAV